MVSVQFSSFQLLSPVWLCDPVNRSTPGLPVHHHLPEFTQTCPSSLWCHPTFSSWVVPFSSCPQSLPASESFPVSQLFAWGGQRTGVSALASFPPKKSQGWSPSEWAGWISLQSKGLSRVYLDSINMLGLEPAVCFLLGPSVIHFSIFFFASGGLLNHFLECHFNLSVVFLSVSLWVTFTVVALGITLYIVTFHHLLMSSCYQFECS